MSDQEANAENKTAVSLTSAEEINQKLSQLFGEEIAKEFEGKPWIADCRARVVGMNCTVQLDFLFFFDHLFEYRRRNKLPFRHFRSPEKRGRLCNLRETWFNLWESLAIPPRV